MFGRIGINVLNLRKKFRIKINLIFFSEELGENGELFAKDLSITSSTEISKAMIRMSRKNFIVFKKVKHLKYKYKEI